MLERNPIYLLWKMASQIFHNTSKGSARDVCDMCF